MHMGAGSGVLAASIATLGSTMVLRWFQLDNLFYGPLHEICRATFAWIMEGGETNQSSSPPQHACMIHAWSWRKCFHALSGLLAILAVLAVVLHRHCKPWRQLTMSPSFARVHAAWNACLIKAVKNPRLFNGLVEMQTMLFPTIDDREFDLLVLRMPEARQTFVDYVKFFPRQFASPPEFWHGVANQSLSMAATFELFHNTKRVADNRKLGFCDTNFQPPLRGHYQWQSHLHTIGKYKDASEVQVHYHSVNIWIERITQVHHMVYTGEDEKVVVNESASADSALADNAFSSSSSSSDKKTLQVCDVSQYIAAIAHAVKQKQRAAEIELFEIRVFKPDVSVATRVYKVGGTCAARACKRAGLFPPFHPASYVIGCSSSPDTQV
jgi:hypothetical protein